MALRAGNVAGAVDDDDVLYAMASEGRVPHLYRGPVSPSGYIFGVSACGRVRVIRVAVPADTAGGRICRWCDKLPL